MAAFDDFMTAFSYNPETFNEEQFKAAIQAAHDEDTKALNDVVSARDADLASRDERIKKLGVDNWNLLMKQGPKVDDVKPPGEPEPPQEHKPKPIHDMFKKVERK